MGDRTLDIAFWDYDRTRLLTDGSVGIAGVEPRFHGARIVTEIFEGMIRGRYDVSELGMTYFLRTFDDEGRSPFVAIPVFLNRAFRHGAVYVNRASGIARSVTCHCQGAAAQSSTVSARRVAATSQPSSARDRIEYPAR